MAGQMLGAQELDGALIERRRVAPKAPLGMRRG
jgi:hypothetical protein